MNISDFVERGNPEDMPEYRGSLAPRKSLTIVIIVLTATASLGLGILAGQSGGQGAGKSTGLVVSSIPLTHPTSSTLTASAVSAFSSGATSSDPSAHSLSGAIPSGGEVVGDTSTHEYYLPWCKQVGKIASADEKWFASESEATSSGYIAGKSCAGI